MKDIIDSLNKALINQGWVYGERLQRIGNPFEWVDAGCTPHMFIVEGARAFLQYLTMFYEHYPIPQEIKTPDFDAMKAHIEDVLRRAYKHFIPFLDAVESGYENNILCTALVRAQDYCALRTLCPELEGPINHLDIGPGLGTHAIYSLKGFNSCFYGLEATPHSYMIQRAFFRFLSYGEGAYLDLVECENLNLDRSAISNLTNERSGYKIKHIPSWYFDTVADRSIDLISATWVLNELNTAGILWLMSNSSRVLRKRGYLYVRDSSNLKPLRHSVNYDELLVKMGFSEAGRLNVRNRIDLHGIPRVYRKETDSKFSFDDLVKMCLDKFAITAHRGGYAQNISVR